MSGEAGDRKPVFKVIRNSVMAAAVVGGAALFPDNQGASGDTDTFYPQVPNISQAYEKPYYAGPEKESTGGFKAIVDGVSGGVIIFDQDSRVKQVIYDQIGQSSNEYSNSFKAEIIRHVVGGKKADALLGVALTGLDGQPHLIPVTYKESPVFDSSKYIPGDLDRYPLERLQAIYDPKSEFVIILNPEGVVIKVLPLNPDNPNGNIIRQVVGGRKADAPVAAQFEVNGKNYRVDGIDYAPALILNKSY